MVYFFGDLINFTLMIFYSLIICFYFFIIHIFYILSHNIIIKLIDSHHFIMNEYDESIVFVAGHVLESDIPQVFNYEYDEEQMFFLYFVSLEEVVKV